MFRHLICAIALGICPTFICAQQPVPNKLESPFQQPAVKDPAPLELPADQTVSIDEGFIAIAAKCKGEVKWLVLSQDKVKFFVVPQSGNNSIIVSIPAKSGAIINVFAVGLVDGKMTEFVETTITVGNGPAPNPTPTPTPTPTPSSQLHFTFIVDTNKMTPEMARLLNSPTLQKAITDRGCFFRVYDVTSPKLAQKGLDKVFKNIGGDNALVVQANTGEVKSATTVPITEQDIINILTKLTGR